MTKVSLLLLSVLMATLFCHAKFASLSHLTEENVDTVATTSKPKDSTSTSETPWYKEFSCTSNEHWIWTNIDTFEGVCKSNSAIDNCVAYENYYGKCIKCIKDYTLIRHKDEIWCVSVYSNHIIIAVLLILVLIIGVMVMHAYRMSRETPANATSGSGNGMKTEALLISQSVKNIIEQKDMGRNMDDNEENAFKHMNLGEPSSPF